MTDLIFERDLTPEQKAARAERRRRRREAAKAADSKIERRREKDNDVVVKYGDDSWLASKWKEFNDEYFGGKLKRPRIIEWDRSKHRLGHCQSDFNPAAEVIYCTCIGISRRVENYITLRNTLVHEMIHQWCYQMLDESDIRRANRSGMARSRRWWRALTSGMGKDGHHGSWSAKCEELMKKDSRLKLYKHGSADETPMTDSEIKKAVKASAGSHVIVQEGAGRRHFYYVTDECFKKKLKDIQDGNTEGLWKEYKFDPVKLAAEMTKGPASYIGNFYYSGSYFDNLCERDIIKSWDYETLGGHKEPRTRRRRSAAERLFGGWF